MSIAGMEIRVKKMDKNHKIGKSRKVKLLKYQSKGKANRLLIVPGAIGLNPVPKKVV